MLGSRVSIRTRVVGTSSEQIARSYYVIEWWAAGTDELGNLLPRRAQGQRVDFHVAKYEQLLYEIV